MGTEILAVSVDDREKQQMMIDRVASETDGRLLDFPLLSDPDHAVIARYGLLNDGNPDQPIPHPTVFVIDREGVVRWKFIEINYKVRPTNEDILAALEELRGGDTGDTEPDG